MAGSRKWMLYTMDDGKTVAKNVDESNSEALGFTNFTGAASVTATATAAAGLRRMRYVNAVNVTDTTQKRRFWVGKPDNTNYVNGGQFTVDSVQWEVTGAVGERKTLPFVGDTGLTDGDQP